mmetsp:Transcript_21825/g.46069  ORF Transcript_21825/g.46069 Transcript_21825/m.46069 type:complete len:128 (+) Transcript_21825:260-643(+)
MDGSTNGQWQLNTAIAGIFLRIANRSDGLSKQKRIKPQNVPDIGTDHLQQLSQLTLESDVSSSECLPSLLSLPFFVVVLLLWCTPMWVVPRTFVPVLPLLSMQPDDTTARTRKATAEPTENIAPVSM